jgi:hypothetical protein
MLTTLSILSLDQGKIWTDPCPLPRGDAAGVKAEVAPAAPEGLPAFPAFVALIVRFTTFRRGLSRHDRNRHRSRIAEASARRG